MKGKKIGKLLGIAVKQKSRAKPIKLSEAEVGVEFGIKGDFRGKPGKRQVTILAAESWQETCDELGQDLDWTTRRANLFINGLDLKNTIGRILKIGETVFEISGETDPCFRMDEAFSGLKDALTPDWRGGVLCKVLKPGRITIGDSVEFIESY